MSRKKNGQFKPGTSGNASGRPPKVPKIPDAGDLAPALEMRADGTWTSALTGLGTSRDKRMSHELVGSCLPYQVIARYWEKNGIIAKAIEGPTAEAFREGYECVFNDDNDYEDLKRELTDEMEELGVDATIEQAWQFKRAYGAGMILLGTKDSRKMDQPLELSAVRSLDYLTVFEPCELVPEDPARRFRNLGKPQFYRLNADASLYGGSTVSNKNEKKEQLLNQRIHESRLIVLEGIKTSRYLPSTNQFSPYYGSSIVDRFIDSARDAGVAYQNAALIASDLGQPIIKIKNLLEMIAKDEKKFKARMAGLELSRSAVRAILLDEKEQYERQMTSLSNVPELLDRLSVYLSANIDMPLSVLMGYSPTGLGQPGEVELKLWYNKIRSLQRRDLAPILKRIIKMIIRSKRARKIPKTIDIQWFELDRLNEKDRSESTLNNARHDEIYLKYGTLHPDELRNSRWSGRYSHEIKIDPKKKAPGYVAVAPKGVAGLTGAPGGAAAPKVGGAAAAGSHIVGGYARRDPNKDSADTYVTYAGLEVCIESPRGSQRHWIDTDGSRGTTTMQYDYGYVVGTRGADGDALDVYLGPSPDAQWVYVIHQKSKSSGFTQHDEDKAMLGFDGPNHARDVYLQHYTDERFFGGMSMMTLDDFKSRAVERSGQKVVNDQVDEDEEIAA